MSRNEYGRDTGKQGREENLTSKPPLVESDRLRVWTLGRGALYLLGEVDEEGLIDGVPNLNRNDAAVPNYAEKRPKRTDQQEQCPARQCQSSG